jgi:FMN phosphatase YigB (HAD superfamily)
LIDADGEGMNKPVETVLFDFGGTLDANGVAWKERFYAYYSAEGLEIAADAFEPMFFAADNSLVGNLPSATDLSGTVHILAATIEAELARRDTGADKAYSANGRSNGDRGARVASRFLSEASAAFARNRPVLEELGKYYRLGVVSNFYGNLEAVCRGAGLGSLFSVLVDSHLVGVEKPDPAIFQVALDRLEAIPETTVLVGDSLRRDREGARRMGMRFIWMAPQSIEPGQASASGESPAETRVAQLNEIMRILK